jgi:hypothetical protein
MDKFILGHIEPGINPTQEELANVVITRLGIMPRKKGSTDKMHNVLIEMYERSKVAYREKRPTDAIMTVEEMAAFAGITRQTMYDYLKRWLHLDLISKTSYIDQEQNVIIGYKLNGPTMEAAFDKARQKINNHMELTLKYILELQRIIKNEKIKESMQKKSDEPIVPNTPPPE